MIKFIATPSQIQEQFLDALSDVVKQRIVDLGCYVQVADLPSGMDGVAAPLRGAARNAQMQVDQGLLTLEAAQGLGFLDLPEEGHIVIMSQELMVEADADIFSSAVYHELVHVQQMLDGRLQVVSNDLSIWEGVEYDLTTLTPEEYPNLPWEVEAYVAQGEYLGEDIHGFVKEAVKDMDVVGVFAKDETAQERQQRLDAFYREGAAKANALHQSLQEKDHE